jgi:hypothetical protein
MKRLKYVRNIQDLEAYISKEMMPVMEKVGDEMLEELKKQINKDVYTEPNVVYNRTGDFLKAWNYRVLKNKGNPKLKVYFVPSALNKKAHQSIVDESDPRVNLAEILNLAYMSENSDELNETPGWTSGLMTGDGVTHVSHFRRPYWTRFVNKMTRRDGIRKLIKEKAKNAGINLE